MSCRRKIFLSALLLVVIGLQAFGALLSAWMFVKRSWHEIIRITPVLDELRAEGIVAYEDDDAFQIAAMIQSEVSHDMPGYVDAQQNIRLLTCVAMAGAFVAVWTVPRPAPSAPAP